MGGGLRACAHTKPHTQEREDASSARRCRELIRKSTHFKVNASEDVLLSHRGELEGGLGMEAEGERRRRKGNPEPRCQKRTKFYVNYVCRVCAALRNCDTPSRSREPMSDWEWIGSQRGNRR